MASHRGACVISLFRSLCTLQVIINVWPVLPKTYRRRPITAKKPAVVWGLPDAEEFDWIDEDQHLDGVLNHGGSAAAF
jgi:hypothetical protein